MRPGERDRPARSSREVVGQLRFGGEIAAAHRVGFCCDRGNVAKRRRRFLRAHNPNVSCEHGIGTGFTCFLRWQCQAYGSVGEYQSSMDRPKESRVMRRTALALRALFEPQPMREVSLSEICGEQLEEAGHDRCDGRRRMVAIVMHTASSSAQSRHRYCAECARLIADAKPPPEYA